MTAGLGQQPCLQAARGLARGRVAVKMCRPAARLLIAAGVPSASTCPWCITMAWAAVFGLVQIRRAEQHGQLPASSTSCQNDGPQFAPRKRIDAHGRFVQQQQIGRADQRAGEPQFLLHAAGELPGQPIDERPQRRHRPCNSPIAFAPLGNADSVSSRHTGSGFRPRSDLRTGRTAAACSPRGLCTCCGSPATSMPSTVNSPESAQAGQLPPQQRGLAGTVGADQGRQVPRRSTSSETPSRAATSSPVSRLKRLAQVAAQPARTASRLARVHGRELSTAGSAAGSGRSVVRRLGSAGRGLLVDPRFR